MQLDHCAFSHELDPLLEPYLKFITNNSDTPSAADVRKYHSEWIHRLSCQFETDEEYANYLVAQWIGESILKKLGCD